jgi:hypothetical protein
MSPPTRPRRKARTISEDLRHNPGMTRGEAFSRAKNDALGQPLGMALARPLAMPMQQVAGAAQTVASDWRRAIERGLRLRSRLASK